LQTIVDEAREAGDALARAEGLSLLHHAMLTPQYAHDRLAIADEMLTVATVIDARGRVASVHVLRSIPLLDQAAIAAVEQWTYTPTLLNGVPVPIVMTVTVQFTLQGRSEPRPRRCRSRHTASGRDRRRRFRRVISCSCCDPVDAGHRRRIAR
jgi:TonB family protein